MDDIHIAEDSEKVFRNLKLILSYDGTDFAGWQILTMGPQCPTKFAGANRLR